MVQADDVVNQRGWPLSRVHGLWKQPSLIGDQGTSNDLGMPVGRAINLETPSRDRHLRELWSRIHTFFPEDLLEKLGPLRGSQDSEDPAR